MCIRDRCDHTASLSPWGWLVKMSASCLLILKLYKRNRLFYSVDTTKRCHYRWGLQRWFSPGKGENNVMLVVGVISKLLHINTCISKTDKNPNSSWKNGNDNINYAWCVKIHIHSTHCDGVSEWIILNSSSQINCCTHIDCVDCGYMPTFWFWDGYLFV